ncbi:MAG: hypothetical protein HYV27_06495 [Candidatus Hydrogenedentes bacterium]|nr:hypothetical protein [Candidatus Hydrogenedentota bacterium]
MEPHPEYETLSAFIDGEAPGDDRVNRLIQQNEHAARTAVQYRKIGAHMKAMKGPEPAPDFTDRVMAAIADEVPMAPVTPFRRPVRLLIATGALAASIAAVAGLQSLFQTGEPVAAPPAVRAAPPEERLAAAVENLPLEDLEWVLMDGASVELEEQDDVEVDALVASLVTESLQPALEDNGDPGSLSWYDELETLGEAETEAFTALLVQYGGEV